MTDFDAMVSSLGEWASVVTATPTIALHTIAACQQAAGIAAYIDLALTFDPDHAGSVDVDELYIAQPETLDDGYAIAMALLKSRALDVIAIESAERCVLLLITACGKASLTERVQ